jgi:hypothetical protein
MPSAQPRDSRLLITVVDQTGGVLPGATVTIAGQDDATKSVLIEPATASAEGVAMFVGLRPGRTRSRPRILRLRSARQPGRARARRRQ